MATNSVKLEAPIEIPHYLPHLCYVRTPTPSTVLEPSVYNNDFPSDVNSLHQIYALV